ncbi:MAG: type II secretion system F family protein, partial [bacterium]|nr:type II secretion system F family protein [bacterium]
MANFKYTGIQTSGAVIKGVINSSDKRSALKSIRLLALKRSFQIKKVIAERTFEYKVRNGNEKAVTGEQKAFDRSEVEAALRKLGYRIIYVRNMPFSLRMKPSYKDIVIFIRICADLLREKLPYDEILQTVGTDMENKILKRTIRDISNDLKEGKEGREVFGKHEKIFGKFPTHMLSVASTSGNMAAVYESAARFMERNEEFKKNLRQVLVMPLVVSFFMMAAVIFYVAYIFPKTVELFTQYDIEIPPMTAATMKFSQFLQDNFMLLSIITISMIAAFIQFFRSPRGRYILDKLIIKIPYAGGLLHKTSIEIFARVFHAL